MLSRDSHSAVVHGVGRAAACGSWCTPGLTTMDGVAGAARPACAAVAAVAAGAVAAAAAMSDAVSAPAVSAMVFALRIKLPLSVKNLRPSGRRRIISLK